MSLDTDVTGFLLGVLESPTTPVNASLTTTTTTAASVFPGMVGGAADLFAPPMPTEIGTEMTIAANLTSLATSLATPSAAAMNPFMSTTVDKLKCGHFTVVARKLQLTVDVAEACRFWSEGIFSSVVAAFGLMGNLVSIWVLSVPEMRNSFNRLLLALAIIDCMFIVPGILIYTSKAFSLKSDWYNWAFPIFLYPFSEIALCSSVYMTVAIAVERYIGLCRPLQRLSSRPCSAKVYIIPVVVIALLLNITKFLESETVVLDHAPVAHSRYKSSTKVQVTDLRVHPDYITYYQMWTRLIATGVLPLVLLALLNTKIYLSIRQSKQQLRILAIRSALPMATILSKAAPEPPPGPGAKVPAAERGKSPAKTPPAAAAAAAADQQEHGSPKSDPPGERSQLKNHLSLSNGNGSTNVILKTVTEANKEDIYTKTRESVSQSNNARGQPLPAEEVIPAKETSSPTTADAREALLPMKNGHASKPLITRSASAFESPTAAAAGRRGKARAALLNHGQRSASARDACRVSTGTQLTPNQMRKANNNNNINATAPIVQGSQAAVAWQSPNSGADVKLAPILFGVVIVFVLCNSLRVILNIYDFSVLDFIIQCEKKGVSRLPPAWILCSISVSHLLLMVNSSVNFLVYCVAGTRFRRILMHKVRMHAAKFATLFRRKDAGMDANDGPNSSLPKQEGGAGAAATTCADQPNHRRMMMLSSRQSTTTSILAPSTTGSVFGGSIRRNHPRFLEELEEDEDEDEEAAALFLAPQPIEDDDKTEIVLRRSPLLIPSSENGSLNGSETKF